MILNKNSPRYRELLWTAVAKERADEKVICNLCGMEVISGDDWHESHTGVPAAHEGNKVGIAHKRCNELDNNEFVTPFVAKGKRMWRNHHGITGPGLGPHALPAGRHSAVKKKINGQVVSRQPRGSEHKRVMDKLYPWGRPE